MNKTYAQRIKDSKVWNKDFSDWDEILDEGILKCENITKDNKALLSIMRTAHILEEHMSKNLESFGISPPQLNVLECLYFSKLDSISQNHLSTMVFSSKSNISTMITRMEEKKLLLREENTSNKREKIIKLTPEGRALLERVFASYEKCPHKLFEEKEAELMIKSLKSTRDLLKHN